MATILDRDGKIVLHTLPYIQLWKSVIIVATISYRGEGGDKMASKVNKDKTNE